jgi:hypothetical protein
MFATGLHTLDAQDDFRRARRSAIAAGLARRLTGRGATMPRPMAGAPTGAARREVVPLESIVGTLEPSTTFDARFRPTSNLVRARWERVALAHRKGMALPPISLVRRPDGDYVIDGRHRVSVARALGHKEIEAWVRGLNTESVVASRSARTS